MPRPRSFEVPDALEAAIDCFWDRGYETTSIRDLTERMGISAPSLYNAFGDKRQLFVLALERYADCRMRERIRRLEATCSPKLAIQRFFDELISRSLSDKERRGCLIVNSALEVAPHDRELRAVVSSYLGELESFFRRCLERAQADTDIGAHLNCHDTARLLLAVLLGVRVAARSKPDRTLLEGMVRPAMALLETSKPSATKGKR